MDVRNGYANMGLPDDIYGSAVRLRHELHRSAELSSCENATKRLIADYLAENTSLEIHDMGGWLYAAYRRAPHAEFSPAFRAEMDALPIPESCGLEYASKNPGVSHKCGHDGHSAALCAFARMVDRYGSDSNIFFLFQHAEETGAGALECRRLLDVEKIDEIYGFHNIPGLPLGSVAVHSGTAACASKGLILHFGGAASHASQPERGRNPAFAVSKLVCAIPDIAAPRNFSGMTLCTVIRIDVGEEAFGTSAGDGRLMLTIRAEHEDDMNSLENGIIALARRCAEEDSLSLDIESRDVFPETCNHESCAERLRTACRELGIPLARWDEPFRSSEDFGVYTKCVPGALFYIGCGENHPALHTAEYDFPDIIMKTAVPLYCRIAGVHGFDI